MNRKDELKTEILTNIKDEIIDKQTEKRYRLMTRKRRPKWIIPSSLAAAILIAVMVPIFVMLFAKQVPIYEGMSVLSENEALAKIEEGAGVIYLSNEENRTSPIFSLLSNESGNNGNHYGHDKKPVKDIVGDDDSLSVESSNQLAYYTKPGQDIYIYVHISNPDSFEILSFTLNGQKYSSYMFEEGSDLETLILKVNVGDAEGVVDYTIDAIKYVDGTKIKDVIMRGDRTASVGIYSEEKQPTAKVTDEFIGINDISFKVDITDRLDLISRCGGKVYAVLCDDEKMVSYKELELDKKNEIKFSGIDTDSDYRYCIAAYYDSLDGRGNKLYILYEQEFTTQGVVAVENVNIGKESISFGIVFNELYESKKLSSMTLYHGEEKVKEFDVGGDLTSATFEATGLLSDNEYKLILKYENQGATETVEYSFKTAAKAEPEFTINDTTAELYAINGEYELVNTDSTLLSYSVKLFKGDELVKENTDKKIEFESLDYYTYYTVRITYTFDVNDGKGVQEKSVEQTVTTLPYINVTSVSVLDKKDVYLEGDSLTIRINVDNPLELTVLSVTIDGIQYSAKASSTTRIILVDIKDVLNISEGMIESFTVKIDGTGYSITDISETKLDIKIMGITEIISWEIVNENFERVEYATLADKVYVLISATKLDMNAVTGVKLTYDDGLTNLYEWWDGINPPYSFSIKYEEDEIKMLDDGRFYVELKADEAKGYTFDTVSVTYKNDYIESAEAVNKTYLQHPFVMLNSDEVRTVSSIEELLNMEDGYRYELTCDLDFSADETWQRRGFSGILDGKGYAIQNFLLFAGNGSTYAPMQVRVNSGFFVYLDGIIENLSFESFVYSENSAQGSFYATGVIGMATRSSIIRNCTLDENSEIVTTRTVGRVGGICGESYGIIENCTNNARIRSTALYIGGICGENGALIKGCENYGYLSGSLECGAGGIVGLGNVIEDSSNRGDISAIGECSAGGIAAIAEFIKNCDNYGTVEATNFAEGISPSANNNENCNNYGDVRKHG